MIRGGRNLLVFYLMVYFYIISADFSFLYGMHPVVYQYHTLSFIFRQTQPYTNELSHVTIHKRGGSKTTYCRTTQQEET
jgi:hypothetical protein